MDTGFAIPFKRRGAVVVGLVLAATAWSSACRHSRQRPSDVSVPAQPQVPATGESPTPTQADEESPERFAPALRHRKSPPPRLAGSLPSRLSNAWNPCVGAWSACANVRFLRRTWPRDPRSSAEASSVPQTGKKSRSPYHRGPGLSKDRFS